MQNTRIPGLINRIFIIIMLMGAEKGITLLICQVLICLSSIESAPKSIK